MSVPAVFQCGDCLTEITVQPPVPRTGVLPCPTCPPGEGGVDLDHAYRHAADAWDD